MAHAGSIEWNLQRAALVKTLSNEKLASWVEGRLLEHCDGQAAHDLREVAARLRGAPDPGEDGV